MKDKIQIIHSYSNLKDGIYVSIIEESLWDKVQAVLESKKGKPARIYNGKFPLTEILKCPKC